MDDSLASVTVQFDLDMRQLPPRPCSELSLLSFLFLFSLLTVVPFKSYFSTALGSPSPVCVWRSPRQISFPLGFGLSSPFVVLDLSPGIASGLLQSVSGSTPAVALLAAAQPAQQPQPPLVLVGGPDAVALCAAGYVVSADASVALSLFAAPVFAWSASPSTPALAAAIAASAGGPRLDVKAVDLVPGVVYTVTATIGGVSGSHRVQLASSSEVKKEALLSPCSLNGCCQRVGVRVLGPSNITMFAWNELILEAEVLVCAGGVYSYAWTLLSGPPGAALDRFTQVTSTYRVAPNALTAGQYVFQISVDRDDRLASVGRAVVAVSVLPSALVALPTGQQVDTRLRDVTIDGSRSQDADRSPEVPSYAWQCREQAFPAAPCVVSSLLNTTAAAQQGLLQFPAANLAPGPWLFGLVFAKGSRRARAGTAAVVDWNEAPAGRVELYDPARTQLPGYGSPAVATNLFNAREPLVLSAGATLVAPGAQMAAWTWSSASSALSLAGATGAAGAYLYLPPGTLAPGAGYAVAAQALDSRNFSSLLTFSFAANDEPRAALPGSGCALIAPATVTVLSSVLTLRCVGWSDDGNHYPLAYFFGAGEFALSSQGFGSSPSFDFVLSSVADAAALEVRVRDALGAWTLVPVPLPAGTTVVAAFPAGDDAALISQAAAALISGALQQVSPHSFLCFLYFFLLL